MPEGRSGRNRTFDAMRLCFAYLVLLSHSYDLTGNSGIEPLRLFTRRADSLGTMSVFGFFVLSGYLIVASWLKDPSLPDFLVKRFLRIVPGFVVAAALSVVVCGLVAPGVPHFFHDLVHGSGREGLTRSLIMMDSVVTPPVFPGMSTMAVNGSLWSLQYESRAYLLVALLGVLGLLRWRWGCLAVTALIAIWDQMGTSVRADDYLWHYDVMSGVLAPRMFFIFFVGGCWYVYRDRARFHPALDVLAVCLVVISFWPTVILHKTLAIGLSYLLFRVGRIRWNGAGWYRHVPDISYGVYIFGFPIQQLVIWYWHPRPMVLFPLSVIASTLAGLASWYVVERPMLLLKPRPMAPVDAASDGPLVASGQTV